MSFGVCPFFYKPHLWSDRHWKATLVSSVCVTPSFIYYLSFKRPFRVSWFVVLQYIKHFRIYKQWCRTYFLCVTRLKIITQGNETTHTEQEGVGNTFCVTVNRVTNYSRRQLIRLWINNTVRGCVISKELLKRGYNFNKFQLGVGWGDPLLGPDHYRSFIHIRMLLYRQ